MEDIIAILLVVGVFAAFVWGVRVFLKRMQAEKQRKEQQRIASEKFWEDERNNRVSKVNAQRIDQRRMESYVNSLSKAKDIKVPKPQTRTYTSTTSSAPSRSSDDDGFLTGMLTGYALNALTHKSESSSSSSGSSSSSSWGFDDSDSRKSISSSMSDSWSSSSSSDSWSSSDSGPSSDW